MGFSVGTAATTGSLMVVDGGFVRIFVPACSTEEGLGLVAVIEAFFLISASLTAAIRLLCSSNSATIISARLTRV